MMHANIKVHAHNVTRICVQTKLSVRTKTHGHKQCAFIDKLLTPRRLAIDI